MVIHDTECRYRDLVLQGEKHESLVTLVYCDMRAYGLTMHYLLTFMP